MDVMIAGAGIGGLTTALMLHRRGIACRLYEAAPALAELGVGINVLPHAIRELALLDLLPDLDRIALRTSEMVYLTRQGQEIWREARGLAGGHDVPQFSIHRGRLQAMLHRAVTSRLGPDAVRPGHVVTGFAQDGAGVTLHLRDRDPVRGDVLIGADGVHSRIRAQLHPDGPGLRWNGVMMWRGATEYPAYGDGTTMIVAGGFTTKLVLYPIAPGTAPGRVLMNWVITSRIAADGAEAPGREDWNRRGTEAEVMPLAQAFGVDVIDLPALVRATPEYFRYPMCDRDPLPDWSRGRVTLLGDAAHPMYPVGSNGASQAILDARALADLLAGQQTGGGDVAAALAAYDAARRPATAQIVALNRKGGPEGVIDEVERRAPDGFADLDAVIPWPEREAIVRGYATTAGFGTDQTRLRHA